MATNLLDYAYLTGASYGDTEGDVEEKLEKNPNHAIDWVVADYQAGTKANGFQAATFVSSEGDVVCSYKGSKTGKTFVDDWIVNDGQILINLIPSQVPAATAFAQQGLFIAGDRPFCLVGHSLGGGLAQFVGYNLNLPFITFNAPGTKGNLPGWFKKRHAVRGFNMILGTDPIGNYGRHIGKTERFLTIGAFNPFKKGAKGIAHQMGNVIATLRLGKNATWAQKTLDELV